MGCARGDEYIHLLLVNILTEGGTYNGMVLFLFLKNHIHLCVKPTAMPLNEVIKLYFMLQVL